jgi:hypothetical protein
MGCMKLGRRESREGLLELEREMLEYALSVLRSNIVSIYYKNLNEE